MPNWFIFDKNGVKRGPFSSDQLKRFADSHKIFPQTVIETEDGRRGKAGQVRGLFSAGGRTAPHNSTQSDSSGSDRQSQPESSSSIQRWFFYDANGVKQGPLTDVQIMSFVNSGIINRNTEFETLEGLKGKAENVKIFFPNAQECKGDVLNIPNDDTDLTNSEIPKAKKVAIVVFLAVLLSGIICITFFSLSRSNSIDDDTAEMMRERIIQRTEFEAEQMNSKLHKIERQLLDLERKEQELKELQRNTH